MNRTDTRNPESGLSLNNNVRLLLNGHETFCALKDALNRARHSINLEYFSIHDDDTGRTIKNILIKRARSGVNVRMIIDAMGSWRLGRKFIKQLRDAGVRVHRFMPFRLRNMNEDIIHRDHRKIITVDGTVGFLGGFNIGDVYLNQWRDTHLKVSGDAVHELDRIFESMWELCEGRRESDGEGVNRESGNVPVRIIASGRGESFRAVADEYIRVILASKHRIWITTPYFVPDYAFLEALYTAASRDVDVRIIIPASSKSNHPLVSWASHYYIDGLLEHGVKIFTYRDRLIHAKTLIADSHVASVGTANLDALSFEINYEVQAFVYSTRLVGELEDMFIRDMNNCKEETIEGRRNRPIMSRIKERIGRLMSKIL